MEVLDLALITTACMAFSAPQRRLTQCPSAVASIAARPALGFAGTTCSNGYTHGYTARRYHLVMDYFFFDEQDALRFDGSKGRRCRSRRIRPQLYSAMRLSIVPTPERCNAVPSLGARLAERLA